MTDPLIEDLCRRGDWACVDGNLGALADVARELAEAAPEPMHCELVTLADLCRHDPARAIAAWHRAREIVTAHPGRSLPS